MLGMKGHMFNEISADSLARISLQDFGANSINFFTREVFYWRALVAKKYL
jgi:hypothetical protein